MRRIVAFLLALLMVGSVTGVVVAADSDLSVVFDGTRAHVYQASGGALLKRGGAPNDLAQAFLLAHGRDGRTIASLRVESTYVSRGITHVTFRQELAGIRVAGAYAKVAFNAEGDLVHVIDNLVSMPAAVRTSDVGASRALRAALATILPSVADRPAVLGRAGATVRFTKTPAFRANPTAQRVLLARESGRLEEAFLVTTWTRKGNLLNRTLVDAAGAVAANELRTANDTYNVYAEDPFKGPQQVITGPGSGNTQSPSGWLTGAQNTINIAGNNVHAYLDRDANNVADTGGATVTDGNFLATSNLGVAPTDAANQAVAVQNLFYLNNVLHDTLWAHGFTEATGNFQEDNFSNPGSGSDSVNAEAQDGSGTDNANFATPADGQNPTMQMYLWSPLGTHEVVVGLDRYLAMGASFGKALDATGKTGMLALVNDGVGTFTDGCDALPRNSMTGQIAIVDRGTCNFTLKAKNAQTAGAIGVIVVNNVAGPPFSMGGTAGGLKITAVMVSRDDGFAIKARAGQAGTIRTNTNPLPMLDGDIDSDIVYHEYGHGLTWRMIGGMSGPMSGAIGEGASDTLAMFLNGDDAIGEYSFSNSNGIRTAPYGSSIKTYASMTGSEVHSDGEVYGRIGWLLLQNYQGAGLSASDLLHTWIDGFNFTPAGPTVTDMRDGMLVASGTQAEACLIWRAFATVGVGVGATATVSRRGVITATDSTAVPATCP